MKSKEEKIRERDDHLLKKEKSWRRVRIGAIILSIFLFLILILHFVLEGQQLLLQEESIRALISIGGWVIFWLLIVSYLNLQLGHIDSIKLYRKGIGLEQLV